MQLPETSWPPDMKLLDVITAACRSEGLHELVAVRKVGRNLATNNLDAK